MSCGHCSKDLFITGKCVICYECGECYCHDCSAILEYCCLNCKKKFNKRNKDYQLKNLIKIAEDETHKNFHLLCASLGDFYHEKRDFEKLYYYDLKAAYRGVARCQYHIGTLYFFGSPETGDIDYKEALKWFTWAAENSYYKSFYFLGIMYRDALGTEEDPFKSSTCFMLGTMKGDKRNKEELIKAAKNNFYGLKVKF